MGKRIRGALAVGLALAVACGDDDPPLQPDAGAGFEVTTEHCQYVPVPATAGAGGAVTVGPLSAGAAEGVFDVPVGTALGAYTARAQFLGGADRVDLRRVDLPGSFNPSVGVESQIRIKALALSAGGDTAVVVKADLGFPYEGQTFALEDRLGPEYAGKVLLTVSHSHSAWGQFSGHSAIGGVGHGIRRQLVAERILDDLEAVARAALAARRPARIGIHLDDGFDPDDRITRDRRGENDELHGGRRKDHHLFLIRVDGTDGEPIAALPVFGVHGTIMGEANSLASTDAPGAIERLLEEEFDRPVVVMHLNGAGAEVSPAGHGRLDCDVKPGEDDDPCFEWLAAEGCGRAAAPVLYAAWQAAGAAMTDEIALEMVTRSVELGPRPERLAVRGGALAYAPFDQPRPADRVIFDGAGALASPIDEFNAPVGAALCESEAAIFPAAAMTNTDGLVAYGSCVRIDVAGEILGQLFDLPFESDATHPICGSTRTTVSALRLGDHLIATLPGEPALLIADAVRAASPAGPARTIVLGYSQGEVGYIMTPEDWVLGGYEASINFWGPLEGERVAEALIELMPLAMSGEREDAAAGGADRYQELPVDDGLRIDEPSPLEGTVAEPVPEGVWLRSGRPASGQPAPTLARVSGLARFVWIGEDPLRSTPVVTLERETAPGSGEFAPVRRRSGRPVQDGDLLLTYTPLPLRPTGDEPRTHYWAAEWQAVSWTGAPGLASLAARVGVPLGRYRFRVDSPAYQLASAPFEVQPAVLGVAPVRDGTTISGRATVHAAKGYRLLDLDVPSNGPVPLRGATLAVELVLADGEPLTFAGVAADADGRFAVDAGADADEVTEVRITDAHGNTGTAPL